ncbi:MAG TPA: VOC family protein [Chloroflexota bacterium]|nr:VOC family protein [Chloroflexota bacterium]
MAGMSARITTAEVHHLRLTVSDVPRARAFYSEVLGFDVAMELPPGVLLSNGHVLLGLGPAPDVAAGSSGDRFDENRVGLDHLSFAVGSRQDLDEAVRILDEHDVPHGEIKDSGPAIGIYVLAFRDPDNIQLELTASYG